MLKMLKPTLMLFLVLTLITGAAYPLVVTGIARAIMPAKAGGSIVAHRGKPVGSALLAVRRLVYDIDERPVQWLHGLYRPDRYTYEMQLSRVGGIDAKVWVSKELSAQFT